MSPVQATNDRCYPTANNLFARLADEKMPVILPHIAEEFHQGKDAGGIEMMSVAHFQNNHFEIRILDKAPQLISEQFRGTKEKLAFNVND